MTSVAERQKFLKEGAALETIGALEDRHGDRQLAVGRRRQPKKRTQSDGGSRKYLAVALRRMIRRAVPARCKGSSHRGPTVDKRRRKGPECKNKIKDRGARQQLRLRKERTFGRIFTKTAEMEIETRIVESSTGLQGVTGYCRWFGPFRNEGRDVTSTALGKEGSGKACWLLGMYRFKEGAMWDEDPLLRNVFVKQQLHCNRGACFLRRSMPRCYKQDKLRARVSVESYLS
jgi:hypothetical protein